jgi:uncharacterized membrane protein (DUF106 family)
VDAINRALTRLFDLGMAPLERLPPAVGLLVLSLATAIVVLLAFKWTADQRALVAAKRAMQAAIFEMRLFNDDLALLFRAQGEVLRHSLTYLRLSLAPTLWLIVPMTVLMVHMQFHFGYTGFAAGDTVLVTAHAATPISATIEAPAGIDVETPAVVLPSLREVVWRLRPRQAGRYELLIRSAGSEMSKTLVVSDRVERRSPVRPAHGVVPQLLYPSESPVPADSGLTEVTIDYPERRFSIAGWHVSWPVLYLVLTLVFAWALKGVVGVTM